METPTPATMNPMAPDPEEREIQQLLLQSKRMARLTYIFAVINQLFTFIIQSVPPVSGLMIEREPPEHQQVLSSSTTAHK